MSIRNSFDRCDPVTKFIWVLNTSVVAAVMHSPSQLLKLLGILLVSIIGLSRVKLHRTLRYWRILLLVPSLLFAFHLFLHPGAPLFHLGVLRITREGLTDAALYSLRMLCSIFAVAVFLVTSDIKSLIVGFIRVGIPVNLSYAVYLMLRFVPVMGSEAEMVLMALRMRAPGARSMKVRLLLFYRYLFALVFLGVRRAEQTALAMDARGFGLSKRRTFLRTSTWSTSGGLLVLTNMVVSWGIAISL